MPIDFVIDSLRSEDWPQVAAIYAQGIATGNATFTAEVPSWQNWDGDHQQTCRLVARDPCGGHKIMGFIALSPVSSRCVYGGVAEVSVYVEQAARGAGVGKKLLASLIDHSEAQGLWSL